ncbi:MAG: CDP-alcohol phosphatidyltransferase family protein [Patescibacteria group bacterium]|nr:CDP-alcohol phosphatidyltransferase family protein [Patescibacteria group bacterium]
MNFLEIRLVLIELKKILKEIKRALFKEEGFRFNTPANYVTLLRVVILPFILWSFTKRWETTAITLLSIAILSDFADGKLAAKYGRTEVGKIFDPVADKLLFGFIVAWLWPSFLSKGEIGIQIVLEVVLLFSSFVKIFVKSSYKNEISLGSNIFGKLKFTFQSAEMTCLFLVKFNWLEKYPHLVKAWMVDPVIIRNIVWIAIILALASIIFHAIKVYWEYTHN